MSPKFAILTALVCAGTALAQEAAPAGPTALPSKRITVYLLREGANWCLPSFESKWSEKYDPKRFCDPSRNKKLEVDDYQFAVPDVEGNDSLVIIGEEVDANGAKLPLNPSWIQVRATIGHVFDDTVSEHPIKGFSKFADGKVAYETGYAANSLNIPFRQFANVLAYHDRIRITVTLFAPDAADGTKLNEVDSANFILSYKEEPRPGFLEGALDVATLAPVYSNRGTVSFSVNPAVMYKIPLATRYTLRYTSFGLIPASAYQVTEGTTTSTGFAIGAALTGWGVTAAALFGTRSASLERLDVQLGVGLSVVELVKTIDRMIKSSDANERARTIFPDSVPRSVL